MRLSIIIPVYNVSQWLTRCLTSIKQQGLSVDDYEIVVVNDGSTDDSMAVLDAFRAQELQTGKASNWRIIEQPNAGLSAARNAGTRAAQGDYVWWVDSDDSLEPYCGKRLVERAETDSLDVLAFGLQLVEEDGHIEPYHIPHHDDGGVMSGSGFLQRVEMPPAAWAAIFRRQFLVDNGLEFMEGVLHEDQEFTIRAYLLARRVAFEDVVVYNYYQRAGSIMKSENPKKTDDLLKICQRLWDFAAQHTQAGSIERELFENRVSYLFSQALSNLCRCGIYEFDGDVRQLPYYPLRINASLSKKERYKYRLINVNVQLYMKLYKQFVSPKRPRSDVKNLRTH